MMRVALAALAALSFGGAAEASVLSKLFGGTQAAAEQPMNYERPPASYTGQHFTNSYGCTYSRTQAPGYPMVWHLQVNTRKPGCPNTVPGA